MAPSRDIPGIRISLGELDRIDQDMGGSRSNGVTLEARVQAGQR